MSTSSPLVRFVPSSMRYGQFRYYWLALLVGVTGHGMLLNFTMGWMMFEITGEERDLAFLGIAIAVPAIFLNFIGGVSADRFEPKFLVAGAQSLSATVVVLLAVWVWTQGAEGTEVWHILVTAVAIGALQAIDQPSRASVFPRLVQREHIVNAVVMSDLIWNGVRVLGPTLAGITIERLSIHSSMFFSAAAFYVVAVILSMLRLRPRPPAQGDVLSQVMEGMRYVWQRPIFLTIILLTFCNSMFGMAYVHLMPSFAREVLDVGAGKVGLLLGVSGAGAIAGTIVIANLKDHHRKGLLIRGRNDAIWSRLDPILPGGLARDVPRFDGHVGGRRVGQLAVSGWRYEHTAGDVARPAERPGNGPLLHDLEPVATGYGPSRIRCPVCWRTSGSGRGWSGDHGGGRICVLTECRDSSPAGRAVRGAATSLCRNWRWRIGGSVLERLVHLSQQANCSIP